MPEPCHYCHQPVLLTKHNYRTQHLKTNGEWARIIWHTKCDPFTVTTVVTTRPRFQKFAGERRTLNPDENEEL